MQNQGYYFDADIKEFRHSHQSLPSCRLYCDFQGFNSCPTLQKLRWRRYVVFSGVPTDENIITCSASCGCFSRFFCRESLIYEHIRVCSLCDDTDALSSVLIFYALLSAFSGEGVSETSKSDAKLYEVSESWKRAKH